MKKNGLQNEYDAEFILPWPPSVNKTWSPRQRKGKIGMFLSDKSKRYREEVAVLVREQGMCKFDDWLCVRVDVYAPDKRRRDLDNLLKNIFDALQYAQVVEDDYAFQTVFIKRHSELKKYGEVVVRIKQLGKLERARIVIDKIETTTNE